MPWTTAMVPMKRVRRPQPTPLMKTRRIIQNPQQLLSFVGAAQTPSGYKILESCPSLETDENIQNLIGTKILHAWDNKDRQGWFQGRVYGRNLNARDLARAPSANFSVRYSKLLTVGVKKKEIIPLCHVAYELTSRT